jgi:hypothetical protein
MSEFHPAAYRQKRKFSKAKFDGQAAMIKMYLENLEVAKPLFSRSYTSEDYEYELKLYGWILRQPDAEEKAEDYYNARLIHEDGVPAILTKRSTVERLGWNLD